ncbi:MAG TPA: hypothetical protein VLH18_07085 [Candidatus Limnocylindrales bacterium]|nr:hypothetical protein [Candidatus Limnocylindrales bacterium]
MAVEKNGANRAANAPGVLFLVDSQEKALLFFESSGVVVYQASRYT